MAYSVLEQLKEDELSCALCCEVPGDDDTNGFKHLLCTHIFCKNCLVKLVKPAGRITCPNCRHETVLDSTGSVDKLPSASHATQVIGWINKKQEKLKELKVQMTTDRQCPEHKVQVNFFCIDCSEYICGDCLALTHDKKHTSLHIKTEADSMRKKILEMVKEIDSRLVDWMKLVTQIEQRITHINDDAANAEKILEEYDGHVRKALNSNKQLLLKSIKGAQETKLEPVRSKKIAVTQELADIEIKMAEVRTSLQDSNDYEIFKAHVPIGKIYKEVVDKPPPILTNPTPALRFLPNLIAIKCLTNWQIGRVHTSDEPMISRISSCKASEADLRNMERAVKLAYVLNVPELTSSVTEDRKTKCIFIMGRLSKNFFEKWTCIIGNFYCLLSASKGIPYASFKVNEVDSVLFLKNGK